jgi:hypothetical protein
MAVGARQDQCERDTLRCGDEVMASQPAFSQVTDPYRFAGSERQILHGKYDTSKHAMPWRYAYQPTKSFSAVPRRPIVVVTSRNIDRQVGVS